MGDFGLSKASMTQLAGLEPPAAAADWTGEERLFSGVRRRAPTVLVLYHYFHPDDVVSAVHVAELCEGLAEKGWRVTAMPCNRSRRDDQIVFTPDETWGDVEIKRVWRPPLNQGSSLGRVLNAAWMISRWSLAALSRREAPDAIIIGTDPILSVVAARVWKRLRPETRIAHWCFDLYPEAAVADGQLKAGSMLTGLTKALLRPAYDCCDLIADIGGCMRRRLEEYGGAARRVTLTPWALAEPLRPLPVDWEERRNIFGDTALALLYSGNFGRAHSYDRILALARLLEPDGAKLAFSVRGSRVGELKQAAAGQANVSFTPFASQEGLEARLSAADIHVVSLRDEWTGTVVPSKFFGALAVGRPLLFAGSPDSAIAEWITKHGVGWVLTPENIESIAEELKEFCGSADALRRKSHHCHRVYQEHFSRRRVTDQWDSELRGLLGAALESEAVRVKAAAV